MRSLTATHCLCDGQESISFVCLIKNFFSVRGRLTIIFRTSKINLTAFIAMFFVSIVFSSFSSSILKSFTSFRERYRSSFEYSNLYSRAVYQRAHQPSLPILEALIRERHYLPIAARHLQVNFALVQLLTRTVLPIYRPF